jgi:beta-xylosidase
MKYTKQLIIALTVATAASLQAEERASNPFVTHMFTADPSAHVWEDGRLYVYPSTDIKGKGYKAMDGYHVFSTDDMVTWIDHGEILNSSQVPWGREEGGFMWAPDCAYKNGTYYYYFPHPSGSNYRTTWKIGVATSTSPTSGFKEQGYIKGLKPMIDPCVFIDDDGQAYLYYGGPNNPTVVKLKENMIEIDGEQQLLEGLDNFKEGLWVFKRKGIYYAIYPDTTKPANEMRYAMSDSPFGPFTPKGVFLEGSDVITTHGSIVEYKGQWYLFYHNGALSGGKASNRSICFDKVTFNENGTINKVEQSPNVVP